MGESTEVAEAAEQLKRALNAVAAVWEKGTPEQRRDITKATTQWLFTVLMPMIKELEPHPLMIRIMEACFRDIMMSAESKKAARSS